MIVQVEKDGDISRKQVWLSVWIAVATSSTCKESEVATSWADKCLKEFDKRFEKSEKEKD